MCVEPLSADQSAVYVLRVRCASHVTDLVILTLLTLLIYLPLKFSIRLQHMHPRAATALGL